MKNMKRFFLLLFALVATAAAWAETYTITYDHRSGTFYKGGAVATGWVNQWVSNEDGKPQVTLTASANNINSDNGRMAPGQSQSCTYSLSVENGYIITGFAFNSPTSGAQVTVTPAGESAVVVATGETLVVNSSASSFVYSGSNSGRILASAGDGGSFLIYVEDDPDYVDWTPSIANNAYLTVGKKVSSFTAVDDPADNDHWYILTQIRGGETPMYDVGAGQTLKRTGTSITTSTITGNLASSNAQYLIRFVSAGSEGLYNIQFATGRWITGSLTTSSSNNDAGTYAFYNCNGGSGSYFAWNLNSKSGNRVDNNAAGYTVSFWGSGEISGNSGNNVWYLYETSVEVPAALVDVTYELWIGGEKVNTIVQENVLANSDVNVPASLTSGYSTLAYDFGDPEGTIGKEDCTITVTGTKKTGVITALSELSNSKAYTLTTARGSLGVNETQMVSTYGTEYAASNFAIINYEENLYLYSVAASKFIANTAQPGLTDDLSTIAALVLDDANATIQSPLFFMGMGSNGVNVSNRVTGIVVNDWTIRDAGNQYCIIEAADFDPTDALAALEDYFHPSKLSILQTAIAAAQTVVDAREGVGNGLFLKPVDAYNTFAAAVTDAEAVADDGEATEDDLQDAIDALTAAVAAYAASTVLPEEDATYTLQQKSSSLYMVLAPETGTDGNSDVVRISSEPQAFSWVATEGGYYLTNGAGYVGNKNNGWTTSVLAANKIVLKANPVFIDDKVYYTLEAVSGGSAYLTPGCWIATNADDDQSRCYTDKTASSLGEDIARAYWSIAEVDPSIAYNALIAQLKAINWGTGLNQYGLTGDYAGYTSQITTIISGMETQGYTAENMQNAKLLLANYALNMPSAGKFLRMTSTHGTYLSGTESTETSGRLSYIADADASTIFYFDGTYLYNTKEGWAAAGRSVGTCGATGVGYWFEESTITAGRYSIRFNPDGGTNRYLYAWNQDGRHYADQNGSDHANCVFTLSEVTDIPVSISAVGFATLYTPVALTIPDGVTAYTGYVNGDVLKLEALSEKIPANTAVILEGNEGTHTFTTTTADNFEGTNDLEGTIGGMAETVGNILTLQYYNDKLGLFNYTGSTLAGFKAYLPKSALPSSVHGLTFEFGDATGIQGLGLDEQDGRIYNLAGQRVAKAQKGIYIVNGKKVVIK